MTGHDIKHKLEARAPAPPLAWSSESWESSMVSGEGVDAEKRTFTKWTSNTVEHGLSDRAGRSIGSYAVIRDHQRMIEQAAENALGKRWVFLPEVTYLVTTQATRDGRSFGGGSGYGTSVKTLEEAKALAQKKIAAAGKSFARKVARGEGRQFKKGT